MPRICALQASHSSANSLLFLYDLLVFNTRENSSIVQVEVLNQFITSEPTVIQMAQESSKVQVKAGHLGESLKKRAALGATNKEQYAWMPISLNALGSGERVAFCAVALGLDSLVTLLARLHWGLFQYWKDVRSSWLQFTLFFALLTLTGWLLLGALEVFYVLLLKKNYLIERHLQVRVRRATVSALTLYPFSSLAADHNASLSVTMFHFASPLSLPLARYWSWPVRVHPLSEPRTGPSLGRLLVWHEPLHCRVHCLRLAPHG